MMLSASDFAFAQTKHIQFKGIPINGSLNSFINQLKAKGFELYDKDGDKAFLLGTFAGYSNCMVGVIETKGNVWRVLVLFPGRDSWDSVSQQYEEFKESYKLKYNVTPELYESLDEVYGTASLLYSGFKNNKNVWACLFEIPGGSVALEITAGTSYGELCLEITYSDTINTEIRKSATMDDI